MASEENYASAVEIFTKKRSSDFDARARIRNSIFRVSEFGAEGYKITKDNWYRAGNRVNTGSASERAEVTPFARCVDISDERLLFRPFLDLTRKIVEINGNEFTGSDTMDLLFDLDCLRPLSEWLNGRWCGLYRALVDEKNKYRRIFFLSSLLYAKDTD